MLAAVSRTGHKLVLSHPLPAFHQSKKTPIVDVSRCRGAQLLSPERCNQGEREEGTGQKFMKILEKLNETFILTLIMESDKALTNKIGHNYKHYRQEILKLMSVAD